MIDTCHVCKSKEYKYTYYTEGYWGIVEQHGYCNHCGYMIEQCYSEAIEGFVSDLKKGYKLNGKWYGKNRRKRARLRRKFHIKHNPKDWILNRI